MVDLNTGMNKGVKTTTLSPAPYFAPLLCTIKLINPHTWPKCTVSSNFHKLSFITNWNKTHLGLVYTSFV